MEDLGLDLFILLTEWIPSPQISKPLFAFNDWQGCMLAQIIEVTIGILHVKDHGLALLWNCLESLIRLGISPSGERRLTSHHPFVQVETKVDGTRRSIWSSVGISMVGVRGVFGTLVVVNDLQVFIDGNATGQIGMFTGLAVAEQCFVNLENVSSTLDHGIHDWTSVPWKPCGLGGSDIADLHVISTSSGGATESLAIGQFDNAKVVEG